MKIMRTACAILLLPALVVAQQPSNPTSKPAPGAGTGTAIGNGIKAAITTAFPAISQVINAIWPGDKNNSSKKKDDATAATAGLKSKSVEGQTTLNQITGDLDAMAAFLSACTVAENRVIDMRTMLRLKTTFTPAEALQLKNDWTTAKGRLTPLAQQASVLNNVTDTYIQATLETIVQANSGPIGSIDNDMAAGNTGYPQLASDLAVLDSQLSAANALAGIVVGNVSHGLKDAKNVAAGAQGTTEMSDSEIQIQADFDSMLKERFPKLTENLAKKQKPAR